MRSTLGTKPIYLRGIPAHVVREAKAIAARRGITLAGFVADAIVRAIEQQGGQKSESAAPSEAAEAQVETHESSDDLSSEMRWYDQHRERIARERAGEYVAIIEREIVDHDADFDALARRVFAKYGLRNVFMPLVAAQAKPLRVRSPRMEAARLRQARATRAR